VTENDLGLKSQTVETTTLYKEHNNGKPAAGLLVQYFIKDKY